MKKLKLTMIIGIITTSLSGVLLHFLFEWSGNNEIAGLISPVNESLWEHLKLLFFPMLVFTVLAYKNCKTQYPCIGLSLNIGNISGCLMIPFLYYSYSGILGRNITFIDISIFFISTFFAFFIATKLVLKCKIQKYENTIWCLMLIITILFFIFTFFPPSLGLFSDPS